MRRLKKFGHRLVTVSRSLKDIMRGRYFSLTLLLIIVFLVISIPSPRTMISIKGVTETVAIRVSNPFSATVKLPVARDMDTGRCLEDILLSPKLDSTVYYDFTRTGALAVSVDGPSSLRVDMGAVVAYENYIRLIIDPSDAECGASEPIRMPLNGHLQIGDQLFNQTAQGETPRVLKSGEVSVFGRSSQRIMYIVPMIGGPFEANSLYLASQFSIPAGSQISYALDRQRNFVPWWGFIDFDPNTQQSGGVMNAATNADALAVFAPTPMVGDVSKHCLPAELSLSVRSAPSLSPDCFSIDLAAQLAGDPNLRKIYIFLLTGAALVTFIGYWRLK
ncbi:MAG: hypothetical protein AAGC95_17730 [Pseudomonadota bacterium]